LWLAVIITPPSACLSTMAKLVTGVGESPCVSQTWMPLAASTSATVMA
jgi:hypothetical protein